MLAEALRSICTWGTGEPRVWTVPGCWPVCLSSLSLPTCKSVPGCCPDCRSFHPTCWLLLPEFTNQDKKTEIRSFFNALSTINHQIHVKPINDGPDPILFCPLEVFICFSPLHRSQSLCPYTSDVRWLFRVRFTNIWPQYRSLNHH